MLKIRRKRLMGTGRQSVLLVAIFFMAIFIGVGYSYLNNNLAVTGITNISKNTWNVHFENINVTTGSVAGGTSTIQDDSAVVNFQVPLNTPGDFYEFTVNVVNSGSIDAKIGSIVNTGLTTDQQKYLEYVAVYSDGTEIKENDVLNANDSATILIRVKYRNDITEDDLPTTDQTLNLTFNLNYVQAD